MSQESKNMSWILIAVIVIVAGTALVLTTLNGPPAADSSPSPTVQGSIPPSAQPAATQAPTAAAEAPAKERTANASVIGYGGPVLVRLTLDNDGAIRQLKVGGVRFTETEGVGSRVKEDAFTQLFIGKKPPLKLGEDVDAIAGASISSQAVVDAVNEAAAFLTSGDTK